MDSDSRSDTRALAELVEAEKPYTVDCAKLLTNVDGFTRQYAKTLPKANDKQHAARAAFEPISEAMRGLVKQVDLIYKLAARVANQGDGCQF